MINLFSIAWPVRALGPGLRAALWVAGCRRDCPGCVSPELQPASGGRPVPVDLLVRRLLAIGGHLEGLTISGGEPVDQAEPLARLLAALAESRPEWTILLYSGYTLGEIRELGGAARDLLDRTDVLIDGPYRRDVPPVHPLAGSGNQVIHYLSPKGETLRPAMEAMRRGRYDLGLTRDDFSLLVGVGRKRERERAVRALGLVV